MPPKSPYNTAKHRPLYGSKARKHKVKGEVRASVPRPPKPPKPDAAEPEVAPTRQRQPKNQERHQDTRAEGQRTHAKKAKEGGAATAANDHRDSSSENKRGRPRQGEQSARQDKPKLPQEQRVAVQSQPDELPQAVKYVGPSRPYRFGYATLTGKPNVGKSTLLNRLIGEKLAIVSPRPQTTRDQIRGIYTGSDTQIVFLDTPGIHKARSPLNRAMVGIAIDALESVDVVLLVVDATTAARWVHKIEKRVGPGATEAPPPVEPEEDEDEATEAELIAGEPQEKLEFDERIHPGDRAVMRSVLRYKRKWMVVLNKIDLLKPRQLLPLIAAYATAPDVGPVVPVSARAGDGILQLVEAIRLWLPEKQAEFAADELTDRSMRFLCAELVREQVFLQIREEVPYGVACEVEVFEELDDLTHIQVLVHVEKPAQRGILVGKGGQRMKELATAARMQMQTLLDRKVFLEVHVRVEPQWSLRMETLKQFGYIL